MKPLVILTILSICTTADAQLFHRLRERREHFEHIQPDHSNVRTIRNVLTVRSGNLEDQKPAENVIASNFEDQSHAASSNDGMFEAAQRTLGAFEALDEVNRQRAQHGLPPFMRDDGLTLAAMRCAEVRAASLREGHTANDFGYLPPGTRADSAGCGAAFPGHFGWATCCWEGNYRFAGAAYVMGANGMRFMHLFVRR